MSRLTSKWISYLSAMALLSLIALVVFPTPASACRDCPFPMYVGDNRWVMPDNSFVITIIEKPLDSTHFSVMVRLTEPSTGKILASGGTKRTNDQEWILVPMRDRFGAKINGHIRWANTAHTEVQVKFECAAGSECEI
jgi:hypothetical protein